MNKGFLHFDKAERREIAYELATKREQLLVSENLVMSAESGKRMILKQNFYFGMKFKG